MIKRCCDSSSYYLEYDITDGKVRWLPSYRFWMYDPGNSRPTFKFCPFCGTKLQDILED